MQTKHLTTHKRIFILFLLNSSFFSGLHSYKKKSFINKKLKSTSLFRIKDARGRLKSLILIHLYSTAIKFRRGLLLKEKPFFETNFYFNFNKINFCLILTQFASEKRDNGTMTKGQRWNWQRFSSMHQTLQSL